MQEENAGAHRQDTRAERHKKTLPAENILKLPLRHAGKEEMLRDCQRVRRPFRLPQSKRRRTLHRGDERDGKDSPCGGDCVAAYK